MSNNKAIYVCEHCGNVLETIHNAGVTPSCCGQKMKKVEAGTVEASREKHIPEVKVEGSLVTVAVGSVAHPMTEEHSILWVELETDKGIQRKHLKAGEAPLVTFVLWEEIPLSVSAYCNLHGLWKTEI